MTLLYDYNISVIIGNYLLRALANDEDLNLNSKSLIFLLSYLEKIIDSINQIKVELYSW